MDSLVTFYRTIATRLYPFRWWLAAATPLPVGWIVFTLIRAEGPPPQFLRAVIPWCFVATVWLWGLFLLAYWFHPVRGSLYQETPLTRMFPLSPQKAALGLTILFVLIPLHVIFVVSR